MEGTKGYVSLCESTLRASRGVIPLISKVSVRGGSRPTWPLPQARLSAAARVRSLMVARRR